MNILNLMPAFATSSAPAYAISGEADITVVRGGASDITVGIIINDATYGGGGIVAKIQEGSSGQIDAATDWCIPNEKYGHQQVWARCTNNGATLDLSSNGTGTWYRIDAASEIRWTITQSGIGSKTFDIDVELSLDGATVAYGPANYSGYAQLV